MTDSVILFNEIQTAGGQRFGVGAVEGVDPRPHELTRSHASRL